VIDEKLKPSLHCDRAANRAHSVMRAIRNSFLRVDANLFGSNYSTHVRTHLEFAAPLLQNDIDVLERAQRRSTKRVHGLRNLNYSDRLGRLNLCSLSSTYDKLDLSLVYCIMRKAEAFPRSETSFNYATTTNL